MLSTKLMPVCLLKSTFLMIALTGGHFSPFYKNTIRNGFWKELTHKLADSTSKCNFKEGS